MSSATPPPDLPPPPPPSGQWAYPTNEKGEPKKKYVLWVVFGAAGCLGTIVVAGLLLTLVVLPQLRSSRSPEQDQVSRDMERLSGAILIYQWGHDGQFPEALEALVEPQPNGHTCLSIALQSEEDAEENKSLPDGTQLPKDPWGNPYHYTPAKRDVGLPEIYSLGRDGLPGGTELDEDLRLEVENKDI